MFEQILSRVAARLAAHGIPYMIIGGQAVLLYGGPRLTRDIDITLGVNTDRLKDILVVLDEAELNPLTEDVKSFVKETMVLPAIDEASGIRVDFIFSYTPYELQAISRARKVYLSGQTVCFASPEDLLIHKIFAGRPRDIEDARSVLIKNTEMDIEYIRGWIKEFDASSTEKRYLNTFEELLSELT